MPDIAKAKRNVGRMIDGGATDQEINEYLAEQGLSESDLRNKVDYTSTKENFMNPINASVKNVKDKWGAMMNAKTAVEARKNKGPGLMDLAGVALSPFQGASDVITRPLSQALVNTGLPLYSDPDLLQSPFKENQRRLRGKEAENFLNSKLGTAFSAGMPAKTAVGLRGPQVPQGLREVKPQTVADKALARMAKGQTLGEVQKEVRRLEKAGITDARPIDVVNDTGRALSMTAASKKTPGRDVVADAADKARRDFAGRVNRQVSRTISPTPRNVDDVIEELEGVQSKTARETYRVPYATKLKVDQSVLNALDSSEGYSAIDQALNVAQNRIGGDDAVQGLLDIQRAMQKTAPGTIIQNTPKKVTLSDLQQPTQRTTGFYDDLSSRQSGGIPGPPNVTITPGSMSTRQIQLPKGATDLYGLSESNLPEVPASVLDRVQIALRQRAKNLRKGENANDALAAAVTGRREAVNKILNEVPGLKEARGVYQQQQRGIEAAELAPQALNSGYTDDILKATQGLSDEMLSPSRDILARELQRRVGSRIGSAPSVAESFLAEEPMKSIQAFAGPERAGMLGEGVQAELEMLRNINQVAPNRGLKQLAIQGEDIQTAHDVGDVARAGLAATTGFGKLNAVLIGMKMWARHMGLPAKEAEMIARMSVDPTATTQLVKYLTNRYGAKKAVELTKAAKLYSAQTFGNALPQQENK